MKRWPLHKVYFWEAAPFFRLLLPLAVGILCYDKGLFILPAPVLLSLLVALLVAFSVSALMQKGSNTVRTVSFICFNILLLVIGNTCAYYGDVRHNKNWFGNDLLPLEKSVWLARITDDPAEKENSWKLPVNVIYRFDYDKPVPATGTAFLYLYKDRSPMLLHKGDSILVPGNWQPIKNTGNPFEFDYAAYCRRNNIFYNQFCSPQQVRLYSTNDPEKEPLTVKVHDWCMRQLDKYIPGQTAKGLMQAMILGDEVNLDEDLRQSYADTGIIHIIAISGGNVAVFFVVVSFLLWFIKHKKHAWIKYAIAFPMVWFYVLMAGASPSAIRAAIMFSLLAVSVILQKNNSNLNTLFATAFILLVAQPTWLFSAGFQLSFVAVLSLILFYAPIYRWLSPAHKPLQWLWGAVAASIAAEILVAPLVIFYFHNFPLLFAVANAIAYLFMGIVLVLGMLIIALSFIPAVAAFIGICTVWFVSVFDRIVLWLQGCNPEAFHYLQLSGFELILAYITIAGIAVYCLQWKKRPLFTGLAAACLLLISFCADEWIHLHQNILIVCNSGKTNCAEVISGKTCHVLHTDTTNKKLAYILKPAHTGWQAWKKDTSAANEIACIGGRTILLLNAPPHYKGSFPVDYLIINYSGGADLTAFQQVFSPGTMVIGGNFSRLQQNQLAKQCLAAHITLHNLATNGAFILK